MKGPGELFFERNELAAAAAALTALDTSRLVIIEPNTKRQAPNKAWGAVRYSSVAWRLAKEGFEVVQFAGEQAIAGIPQISAATFKIACAVLRHARLYIGPEGGLHHAAAALQIPAVVIFGGYISPAVTGYKTHTNLFTGQGVGCGRVDPCGHCRDCMGKITVDDVLTPALEILK